MKAGIELQGVKAGHGRVEVLHDVDLALPLGTTVALAGPNGGGKSTILDVVAGLVRCRHGRVLVDGTDVARMRPADRAALGIAYVPAEGNTFGALTVAENLDVLGGGGPPDRALDTFPELVPLLGRQVDTLSGGERQMVGLGRALLRAGRYLLVDEPSRGLSPDATARALAALAALSGPDRLVVVAEQYLTEVLPIADLVYVIERGTVRFAGEPTELADLL